MLYFDRLEIMRDLPNEEIGAIFKAIWEYAESGGIPDLPQRLLPYWKMFRGCIDRNIASYNENCVQNRYNRYKGTCKNTNTVPLDIWEWWASQPDYTMELFKKESWHEDAATINQRKRPPQTIVNDRQQPSTTMTNTNPNTNPNPNTLPSEGVETLNSAMRWNPTPQESDDDLERREKWGKKFKEKSDEMRRNIPDRA